ncbi:MAG TPA: AI-2E family transporter [Acidimicrobiales bacterium]|jgi:predicted PurR-regulated permease PerM|nr:AI-2E family transporter [Acidimicrobiales bacterium]
MTALPERHEPPAVEEAPGEGGAAAGADMPRWVPRAIVLFFAGVAGFLLAWWLVMELRALLIVLLVSLFLSFAIEPAVNWLAARGWRRGTATSLIFLALTVVVVLFVFSIGTVLVRELTHFVESAPGYLQELVGWVNRRFGTEISTEQLAEELTRAEGPLRDLATRAAENAVGLSVTVLGGVFQLFTVALFTWYLVADGPRLRRVILSAMPPGRQQHVLRTWEIAIDKTGGYIYSRVLLAAISALATWIALSLIGVPYPVPLALWVGAVSQFVPVVGTYLAGAMPVLVALLNEPVEGVLVLVYIVVYQQIENYVLAPRVTARTMELHPAVAFGTVLAGAALLGPIGAVLALPAAAILQAFGSTLIDRHEVLESALTSDPVRRPSRRRQRKAPAGEEAEPPSPG